MRKLDDHKREQIIEAASRLFAAKPFHEVKLEDVAAEAKIGKGTLYLYFTSKEDLYASIVHDGLRRVLDDVREELVAADMDLQTNRPGTPAGTQGSGSPAMDGGAWHRLRMIVRRMGLFAIKKPHVFQVVRGGIHIADERIDRQREELTQIVASVLRLGIERGEMVDAKPDLTAHYVVSFVRAAKLYGPDRLGAEELADHLLSVLGYGLLPRRERMERASGGPGPARPPTSVSSFPGGSPGLSER